MNDNTANIAAVTGRDTTELVDCDSLYLHRCVRPDWRALQAGAREAGFNLQAVSAYRSYARQLEIWNAKARGERALLDGSGRELSITELSDEQRLFAILRWSALPGASRHHWGSDIDVIDRAAIGDHYAVQLLDSEVYGNGPFVALHEWLDKRIEQDQSFGFYRPYCRSREACSASVHGMPRGGIAAERWHISHRPTSARFEACLDRQALRDFYAGCAALELKAAVLEHFDEIYDDYICV